MEELSRHPPLAYRVTEIIREHIMAHGLSAGDRLPSERDFAEQLGVSRNVVREALRALELSGLIEKRQGKGAFVRAFDPTSLARQMSFGLEHGPPAMLQLLEARVALETAAVNLAIRHATEEDLCRLDAIVDAMERREESGEQVAAEDLDFHQVLLQATHNEPISRFGHVITEWMDQAIQKSNNYSTSRKSRSMTALHRPIVEAIRQGDVARERRLMEDHIEISGISIVSTA